MILNSIGVQILNWQAYERSTLRLSNALMKVRPGRGDGSRKSWYGIFIEINNVLSPLNARGNDDAFLAPLRHAGADGLLQQAKFDVGITNTRLLGFSYNDYSFNTGIELIFFEYPLARSFFDSKRKKSFLKHFLFFF